MKQAERNPAGALSALVLALSLLAGAPAALAQSPDQEPGFVDFGPAELALGRGPDVNVNLGGAMLSLMAEAMRPRDAALADLLAGLKGLRVLVFEDTDGPAARDFAAQAAVDLAATGWEPAIEVRDADTRVDFYLNTAGESIRGLALMVTEPGGDAIFINVVGELDPAAIGRLISGTGVDLGALTELAGQLGVNKD